MNSIITNYQTPAFIISVVSLTLIVPILLIYKQYFRSLDFLQMSFIFAAAYPKIHSAQCSLFDLLFRNRQSELILLNK